MKLQRRRREEEANTQTHGDIPCMLSSDIEGVVMVVVNVQDRVASRDSFLGQGTKVPI